LDRGAELANREKLRSLRPRAERGNALLNRRSFSVLCLTESWCFLEA
jgi:hypothetical protein